MLSTLKAKLIAAVGFFVTLFLVYFIGRRTRKGELNVAVAQKELELTNAQHAKLQDKLSDLHAKQIDIVTDILAEEASRIQQQAGNKKLTDDEIVKRLTTDGLIR